VPDLLSTDPAVAGGLATAIVAARGRIRRGRDFVEARDADSREAEHLRVPLGSAILAGTFLRWYEQDQDSDQVAEYGEYVLPPNKVLSWEYELPTE